MKVSDRLFLGPLQLGNRLLMAPVKTAFGELGGKVTDRLIAYYRRRARGGVGAIIVEPMFVDAAGKEHPKQLGIDCDDAVDGLRRLVDAIHEEGCKAIAHINHAGRAANPKASGCAPEAPSVLACPSTGAVPEAMTSERVEEIVLAFGAATRRAREAGFDAVEVQCGLGYLVAQFYSPRTNQRDDEWGGETRGRFMERVICAVRDAAGDRIAVTARISASERVEGGLTEADAVRQGNELVDLGVSALHVVSGSACDSPPWYYQHMSLPPGVNAKLARQLRREVDVPVVVAGRLGDPNEIESLFAEDAVDGIALGRPLVADPDLPGKILSGQPELVALCGACLQGCLVGVKSGRGIGCIVNPELGAEAEPVAARGEAGKRVVVVGGGPAGLTAARRAAERGHQVTLLERSEALGGQFALSHLAPGKANMRRTLESMIRLAEQSGADIRTGIDAGVDEVLALCPDLVLVATGAEPVRLGIPGLTNALTGEQVLTGSAEVGPRVLVIGGGLVGIEVAEHLAGRSHEVVVVEVLAEIARDMEPITRKLTMKRLAEQPVTIYTETEITAFDDGYARATGPRGEQELGPFDDVVIAVGTRPVDVLSATLRERGVDAQAIGDAVAIGQIQGAVTSAWELASRL